MWVTADQQEPAWTIGGSYQAVRLIQFRVEFWDRTPLKEQQTIFGRDKQTGAPLGMQHEHDVPDYASDPEGRGLRWTAISGWRIPARRRVSPA